MMLFLVFVLITMVLLYCDLTLTQKTDIAMCEPGYYADVLMINSVYPCMPCSRCPPGQYQLRSCNATHDAVCAACPTNTYSDRWGSMSACRPCTMCSRHQLSHACTPKKDTLCRTKCRTGYYFETASQRCKRCSLCPEVGGDRVYECTQQEGSGNNQCREGSFVRARTVSDYRSQGDDRSPLEYDNQDSLRTNLATSPELSTDFMTTDFSTRSKEGRHSSTMMTRMSKVNLLMTTLSVLKATGEISRQKSDIDPSSSVIPSSAPTSTPPWATTRLGHPASSANSKRRGSVVTANEVLMVLGIITASGLVSFITTYITCHFLMKRGIVKSGDATVGFDRGRQPVKGWLPVPRAEAMRNLDMSLRTSIDML